MASKITMEFKKGDGITHYFSIPTTSWSAGGALFFAAKPAVDNDATDAAAVIDKSFDDTVIVDSAHEEYVEGYETYELYFEPGDITGVNFTSGEKRKKYLGEFQYVPDTGVPSTFPADDQFIEVIVYGDIKRGTS